MAEPVTMATCYVTFWKVPAVEKDYKLEKETSLCELFLQIYVYFVVLVRQLTKASFRSHLY